MATTHQFRRRSQQHSHSRRFGFVDPQEWDSPPTPCTELSVAPKGERRNYICCAPGCACCKPSQDSVLSQSLYVSSNSSLPSVTWDDDGNTSSVSKGLRSESSTLNFSEPSDSAQYSAPTLLSTRSSTSCKLSRYVPQPSTHWLSHVPSPHNRRAIKPIRWPFHDSGSEEPFPGLFLDSGESPLGPLGALISEFNNGLLPSELLEISYRNGNGSLFPRLSQCSIQEIWADWVKREELADANRSISFVKIGIGSVVKCEEPKNWQAGEVIGFL